MAADVLTLATRAQLEAKVRELEVQVLASQRTVKARRDEVREYVSLIDDVERALAGELRRIDDRQTADLLEGLLRRIGAVRRGLPE